MVEPCGPSDACRLWRQLDRDKLGKLFQVHEAQQGTGLRIEALDPGDNGLRSGMHMAIFDGAAIEVQCGYDTGLSPSDFKNGGDVWEIKVKHGTTELDSWECDSFGSTYIHCRHLKHQWKQGKQVTFEGANASRE